MANDDDRLLRAAASLPPIPPDIERETRIRQRCHAALARRVSSRAAAGNASGIGLFDVAAAGALCVYLAVVLTEVVRLRGSI
jgi:hypothetical protein